MRIFKEIYYLFLDYRMLLSNLFIKKENKFKSTNNAKTKSFKVYSISDKRLNQILKYTEMYSKENYDFINSLIKQYKKYNNDYLNGYLNNIYYTYYNKEQKLVSAKNHI